MTLAHGYTINAACDGGHCKNSGQYNCQGEWYGHNKREAFAAMRDSGWTYRGFNCFCPRCTKEQNKNGNVKQGLAE